MRNLTRTQNTRNLSKSIFSAVLRYRAREYSWSFRAALWPRKSGARIRLCERAWSYHARNGQKFGFFHMLHARKGRDIPTLREKTGMAMSQSERGNSSFGREYETKGVTRRVCGICYFMSFASFALLIALHKMYYEACINYATRNQNRRLFAW